MCAPPDGAPANISLPASSPPMDPSKWLPDIRYSKWCYTLKNALSLCVLLDSSAVLYCRCMCSPGYVGDDCSIDYNDCEGHRCQHGAQCVDELNGYSCICPDGYRWEDRQCNMHRIYFGYSTSSPSLVLSSLSQCSGQLCEIPPSALSLCELADCQNNAPCVERGGHALCQCPPEFGGPRCEKLVSVNFVDRDSYLLLSDLKNWPQANITLQVLTES